MSSSLQRRLLLIVGLLALAAGLLLALRDVPEGAGEFEEPRAPATAPVAADSSSDIRGDEPRAQREAAPSARREARSATVEPDAAEVFDADDLVVEVVDARGQAVAGLPLALSKGTPWQTFEELMADGRPAARTDAAGVAVFPGQRKQLVDRGEPLPSICHLVAFDPLPRLELTRESLEKDRVRSVQPDWGAIELRVVELDGSPARQLEEVRLHLAGDRPLARLSQNYPTFRRPADGPVTRFPFVDPLGSWLASARREDSHEFSWSADTVQTARGVTQPVEIRFGADQAVLCLRLLDDSATPLRGGDVSIELQTGASPVQAFSRSVDANGFVQVEAPWQARWRSEFRLRFERRREGQRKLVGRLLVDGKLSQGRNDLDDLQLELERLLVRGRVIDEAGRGVPGATIGFGTRPHFSAQGSVLGNLDGLERRLVTSGEGGRFAIGGATPVEPHHIWAFIERLEPGKGDGPALPARSEALEYAGPEQEVVLTLKARLRPSLRLYVPDGWISEESYMEMVNQVRVEVAPTDANLPKLESTRRGHRDLTCTVSFEPTDGQAFDVRCWLREQLIHESLGVRQEGSGPLLEVDLSAQLYRHRITLVPAAGEPADVEGTVQFRPAGDASSAWARMSYFSVPIELVTRHERVDVRVQPQRHEEARLENLAGESTLTLGQPYRVRLALVTDGPLPEPPYHLQAYFTNEEERLGAPEDGDSYTSLATERIFLLPTHGRLRVQWFLHKLDKGAAWNQPVFFRDEFWIHVADQAGEQRIELEIDGEQLQRLRDEPPF